MVAATLAIYRAAPVAAPPDPAAMPWPAQRLRDALGYLPWQPPAPPADVLAARRTLRAKLAGAAKRLRRTAFGSGLYDLLPSRWTEALRARLR
jgi:hypothetical protein